LDDILTSVDSEVGDPFSATVVDEGEYRNARVYGHISGIDTSGRIKGRTSIVLRFDPLVMPDGHRTPIHAEIIELYHAPSGVEGVIESGGRGRTSVEHTAIGAGAGALLGGIFRGGKGAGIGWIIGGVGGLGATAFHGYQKITLDSGQELLIRITGHN